MNTVYIIQNPEGKEVIPATRFGRIQVILSGRESIKQALDRLHDELRNFQPTDYLILIGNPINIGLGLYVAMYYANDIVQVLQWNPKKYEYFVEFVDDSIGCERREA